MAEQVTTIASQFYHNAAEPIDYSAEVDTLSQLSDPDRVAPYKGKLVHVKNDNKIYICAGKVNGSWEWRPVMSDDGTAFFLSSQDGEVFRVTVGRGPDGQGRVFVSFPEI